MIKLSQVQYMTVADEALKVFAKFDGEPLAVITSLEEWESFVEALEQDSEAGFMCSSSIDYPEEFTTNEDVIAICRHLRDS